MAKVDRFNLKPIILFMIYYTAWLQNSKLIVINIVTAHVKQSWACFYSSLIFNQNLNKDKSCTGNRVQSKTSEQHEPLCLSSVYRSGFSTFNDFGESVSATCSTLHHGSCSFQYGATEKNCFRQFNICVKCSLTIILFEVSPHPALSLLKLTPAVTTEQIRNHCKPCQPVVTFQTLFHGAGSTTSMD